VIHNELNRATELLQGFKRIVGIDRAEEGVSRIGETLTPILDIFSRVEWEGPRGEYPFFEENFSAAAVGFRSIAGIRNTSSEQEPYLVTVLAGSGAFSATGDILGALSNTDIGGDAALTVRDGRVRNIPFARLRSDNTAALPAGISAGQTIRGQVPYFLQKDVILRPNQSFYFYPSGDNIALSSCFYGRVRKMLAGEPTLF
jgi:hypothetical protein